MFPIYGMLRFCLNVQKCIYHAYRRDFIYFINIRLYQSYLPQSQNNKIESGERV